VNLLAVDPGIDVTGVAVFRVAGLRTNASWSDLPARLVVSGSIKTPGTMASMYMASGGLICAAKLQCCKVLMVPAPKMKKKERAAIVRTMWPTLGRTNEDQRDAIYLGAATILDNRRRWTA